MSLSLTNTVAKVQVRILPPTFPNDVGVAQLAEAAPVDSRLSLSSKTHCVCSLDQAPMDSSVGQWFESAPPLFSNSGGVAQLVEQTELQNENWVKRRKLTSLREHTPFVAIQKHGPGKQGMPAGAFFPHGKAWDVRHHLADLVVRSHSSTRSMDRNVERHSPLSTDNKKNLQPSLDVARKRNICLAERPSECVFMSAHQHHEQRPLGPCWWAFALAACGKRR